MCQQDDHCWIVANGTSWAIWRVDGNGKVLRLWRGEWPDLAFAEVDVSHVDWESYCGEAARRLEEE